MAVFEFQKTYDFKQNRVLIGPELIGGYGDDGGIEYEPASDIVEHTVGADGEVTVSRNNDRRVVCTITLKETSNSIAILDGLRREQQQTKRINPLPFLHNDAITGDKVTSGYCTFLNWATPSKARAAGERQFRVLLPYAADGIQEGPNNEISI